MDKAKKKLVQCPNYSCEHKWETSSQLVLICCPSCMRRFKNPHRIEVKNE